MEGDTITTIVLGIDGGTFDLFYDWIEDLPTIANVFDRGVGTRLKSVTPPVTSPAWRCYAAGKQPSSIGTYWWRQFDPEEEEFIGVDQVPLTSKCYWEYLSEYGDKVAIIGVPLNIPPREVNGWIVSGGPYADEEDYTYPSSLQKFLEETFAYKLHPSTDPASEGDPENQNIIDELEEMIHQRFDVAEWFLTEKSPGFLNLSLFYINHLQHMAWQSSGVKQLWEVLDTRLEKLISEDDNVIIHSDHGLHEIERVFYINGWLTKNGYLKVDEPDPNQDRINTALNRFNEVIERLGVKSLIVRILPDGVKHDIREYQTGRIIDPSSFEKRIDFDQSIAVGLPHGIVYVLDESMRDHLKRELEIVVDPQTGLRMCSEVIAAEEVYPSPIPDDSPDLFIRYTDGIEIKDINADDERTVFGERVKFQADNHLEGILIAAGPDITDEAVRLDQPRLIDLAPTLLHLNDAPVAEDMDGRVLTEIFAYDSNPAKKDIQTVSGTEFRRQATVTSDDKKTKDRLRDLGYLE